MNEINHIYPRKTLKESKSWIKEELKNCNNIYESEWRSGIGYEKIKVYNVPYNEFFIIKW